MTKIYDLSKFDELNQLACDMFDRDFEVIPENRQKLIDWVINRDKELLDYIIGLCDELERYLPDTQGEYFIHSSDLKSKLLELKENK